MSNTPSDTSAGSTFPEAVAALLRRAFKDGHAPSRAWLVLQIKKEFPDLNHPRLDLEVGRGLNRLVDNGILTRIKAKFYAPGSRYSRDDPEG